MTIERTLADDFLRAAALTPKDRPNIGGFQYVAHLINHAQRFQISTDIRITVCNLLDTRPSNLLEATKFARLPFPVTWFEWTPPDQPRLKPGQHEVTRVGVLMQQVEKRSFQIFTCWRLKETIPFDTDSFSMRYKEFAKSINGLGISALEGAWDFDNYDGSTFNVTLLEGNGKGFPKGWFQRPIVSESMEKMLQIRKEYNPVQYALKDPKELKALQTLERAACYRIHEFVGGEYMIAKAQQRGEIDALVKDLEDELGPVMGMLIMLNSKNCVETAKIEIPHRLNQARKKQGKPEFVTYSTVNLKLSKSQSRVMDARGYDPVTRRRHFVRGHFKIRKTGVFYWTCHMAGSEEAGHVIHKKYEVKE
jgi:hypothetical protein